MSVRRVVTGLVLLVALALAAVGLAAGACARVDTPGASAIDLSGDRYYLSAAEIAEVRENVAAESWAKVAWQRTLAKADEALGATPQPADPTRDYVSANKDCNASSEGWYCGCSCPARSTATMLVTSRSRKS
jgi:hypothetical protein